MFCKYCGADVLEKASFCKICGSKIEGPSTETVVFCKFCGTENLTTSSYCKRCGSRLESNANPIITVNVNEVVPVQPKEKKKKDIKRTVVNLFLALIEATFILRNLVSGLIFMGGFNLALQEENGEMAQITLVLTVIIPFCLLIFICAAILYICLERTTKSLVIYLLPFIILSLIRMVVCIIENDEFADTFWDDFIPIIFAIVVKVLVVVFRMIKKAILKKIKKEETE